ncbi:hypothetical protein [Lachnospira eligens]|jgi:hypothetical protein|uniref:Uncharacterized protein n=1 Tax=Lachnospira eligens TaxID=39485 RepID=A0A415MEP7_9FIRM|nr:hypothetical protein [Lachnospira eligens]RHA50514.1 hypothetical protein DW933_02810 [Lachnospira eligens]RHL71079.1 hypothetical protein DW007_02730 [Lachnospira eligens]
MYDLFEDICMERLIFDDVPSDDILLMYPYKLRNESILRDNICNMKNVIREYIKEVEQYSMCVSVISKLIWDSQKISMQNEADEHQRKADKLAEQMNDGISPYAWCIKKNFDKYIDYIHYKADYLVYLDKI